MSQRAVAHINLNALAHNLSVIKRHAPHSKILSMVKADAYGHGIATCLSAFEQSDAFGVACLDEARYLRSLNSSKPIVLMEGCLNTADLEWCIAHHVAPVLHHADHLPLFSKIKKTTRVWIEIDTGMHRLGFLPEQVSGLLTWLQDNPHIQVECWFSHFSDADSHFNDKSQLQFQRFESVCGPLNAPKSFAQSAATVHFPHTHFQWVRPGLIQYGVCPLTENGADWGLQPVMTLTAPLVATRRIEAGESVGYASTWRAAKETILGTIAIGYGDGYPWRIAPGTPVLLNGHRVYVVGRVSMDFITVDLSDCPPVSIGATATLWGPDLPLETIAAQAHTIPYVLLAGLTQRVKKSAYT